MGRRPAVLGAVDGPGAGPGLQRLRGRRRARVTDVVRRQIPAFQRCAAQPGGRYDVGCLYIGVNDVRGPDWDAVAFAADFARALGFLRERCERVVTLTAPLRLGYPPAGRQGGRRSTRSSCGTRRPAPAPWWWT